MAGSVVTTPASFPPSVMHDWHACSHHWWGWAPPGEAAAAAGILQWPICPCTSGRHSTLTCTMHCDDYNYTPALIDLSCTVVPLNYLPTTSVILLVINGMDDSVVFLDYSYSSSYMSEYLNLHISFHTCDTYPVWLLLQHIKMYSDLGLMLYTGCAPSSLQPVPIMPSSPSQQAVTREKRHKCLQWPDHLVLISIIVSVIFFLMVPLNILSLVCSIIVSTTSHQHAYIPSQQLIIYVYNNWTYKI